MPRSLPNTLHSGSADIIPRTRMLGFAWGAVAGAVIGVSISLTIGLFYSDAGGLILAFVSGASVLGALFGYVMASLLSDDVALTGRAALGAQHAQSVLDPVVAPLDHKALYAEKMNKVIPNQKVMATINSIRAVKETLPPYRPDAQVFELIISSAHKPQIGTRQAGH